MPASQYFQTGKSPRRGEGSLNGGVPHYYVYETKDGKYISIGALEPQFYQSLCRTLNREDLIPLQGSEEKREEIFSIFREAFLTKTRDEWFKLLNQTETCVAPVHDLEEVFSDPHVIQRNMVLELEHPEVGKVKQVGISVKLSETPGAFRSFAPFPGEHTDEILAGIGYAQERIEELKKAGDIG